MSYKKISSAIVFGLVLGGCTLTYSASLEGSSDKKPSETVLERLGNIQDSTTVDDERPSFVVDSVIIRVLVGRTSRTESIHRGAMLILPVDLAECPYIPTDNRCGGTRTPIIGMSKNNLPYANTPTGLYLREPGQPDSAACNNSTVPGTHGHENKKTDK